MSENNRKVYLVSNGDFRDPAGVICWPRQKETLQAVESAFASLGLQTETLPKYDSARKHGFITKQCEGASFFSSIPGMLLWL